MSHTECKSRCLLTSSGDSKKAAAYKTAEVGERYRLGIIQQLWVQTGYLKLYHQSKESKHQELTRDSNIKWRNPQRPSTSTCDIGGKEQVCPQERASSWQQPAVSDIEDRSRKRRQAPATGFKPRKLTMTLTERF